jgi:hypothetical protein
MAKKSRSRSRSRRHTRKIHYGGESSLVKNNVRKAVIKSRENSSVKAKNALNKSLTAQGLANTANSIATKAVEEEKQAITEQEKTNQETQTELAKLTANLEQKRSEIESSIKGEKNEKQRVMIAEQEQKQAELTRQLEEGKLQLKRNLDALDAKISQAKIKSDEQLQAKQKEITNAIAKQKANAKTKRNAAAAKKNVAVSEAVKASVLANQAANEAAKYAKTASEQRLLTSNGSPSGTNIPRNSSINPSGSQPAATASSGNSGSAVTPVKNEKYYLNFAAKVKANRIAAEEAAEKAAQEPPKAVINQTNQTRKNLTNKLTQQQTKLSDINSSIKNQEKKLSGYGPSTSQYKYGYPVIQQLQKNRNQAKSKLNNIQQQIKQLPPK